MSFWTYCYGVTLGVLREIWILVSNANIISVVSAFIIISVILFCIEKKESVKVSYCYVVVCSLYLTFLITITVLGRLTGNQTDFSNLFATYIHALNGSLDAKYDVFFNVILFIPVGWLISRYSCIKCDVCVLIVLPIMIEITQLITSRGIFELSDIFNNIIGGFIGFGMVQFIK